MKPYYDHGEITEMINETRTKEGIQAIAGARSKACSRDHGWDRKCGRADNDATDVELALVIGHRFKTVRIFRHMWSGYQRDSEIGRRVLHPTQKPVALMSWCLGFFPDAKTVVDPYMGSGPVARACKDAGLRYVGIELVEAYCEIAAKRLAQEVLF